MPELRGGENSTGGIPILWMLNIEGSNAMHVQDLS